MKKDSIDLKKTMVLAFLVISAGLAILLVLNHAFKTEDAQENQANQATNINNIEYMGTITCFNPQTGEQIYTGQVEGWEINIHGSIPYRARTPDGTIATQGLSVSFLEDGGNRVHLYNFPCMLVEHSN